MEDVISAIGLNPKQGRLYMMLLEHGKMNATQLSDVLREPRTNVYALASDLIGQGLVLSDESQPVRRYAAAPPDKLTNLVRQRIERQQQAAATLQAAMPRLKTQFALSSDKPGIVQMAGLDGFRTLLEDMARSKSEILLVASDETVQDPKAFELLLRGLAKRKAQGITTRALFHHGDHDAKIYDIFQRRGIETRFVGEAPFTGEVVLYESNVVFTVYQPNLIVTILTDARVSETMCSLFELLWLQADGIS